MFLTKNYSNAIANSIIFIGTSFIPYLARKTKNTEFYLIDITIMFIFAVTEILESFGFFNYNNPYYGPDKILHFSAGLVLAWFASIYLRPHIKNKLIYVITIISFAVAVGGLWEVYEWMFSILPPPFFTASAGYADSMMDIIADTLGACVIATYLWKKKQ
jgi:uncharacterized membrane protein YjdF